MCEMDRYKSFLPAWMTKLSVILFSIGTTQPDTAQHTRGSAPRAIIERITRNFPSLHSSPNSPETPTISSGESEICEAPGHDFVTFSAVDVPPRAKSSGLNPVKGILRCRKRKGCSQEGFRSVKLQKLETRKHKGVLKYPRSVYTKYREDYPSIPVGGPLFEDGHVLQMLDVTEHNESIFILMEWSRAVQGSKYSWEELHISYVNHGDHVTDFLVDLASENQVARRALKILGDIYELKICRIIPEQGTLADCRLDPDNRVNKFVELSKGRNSILMLVEWERPIRGSRHTFVEIGDLYRFLGDVFLYYLDQKALYSDLAADALAELRDIALSKASKSIA